MKTTQKEKRAGIILKKLVFATFIGLLVMQISSCKTNNDDKKMAHLSVRMTDAPANYDAVMVDVQGVEVVVNSGTVMLTPKAGIYNLLDFSNGLNTLIATGDLDAGTVSQIRLILGTNSTIKAGGVVYPLSTPSAMQTGLKLQINQAFEPGVSYEILLDFDASQSIVLQGNGEYQLKPVIRTIDTAISGSIKGSISPIGGNVLVTATSNGITYSSVTNATGNFLISGLPAGTYSVTITPILPLLPITITGKTVTVGVSTDLGITILL